MKRKMRDVFCSLLLLGLVPGLMCFAASARKSESSDRQKADVIVFSYHRPLQLYAFLESLQYQSKGANRVCAIVRADTPRFKSAYDEVHKAFPSVTMIFQKTPPLDFKQLTMKEAFDRSSKAKYLAFAVDDIVMTHPFDFTKCTKALEKCHGHGFFLRLGKNIDFCYSENIESPVPFHKIMKRKFLVWDFSKGLGDWKFPHNVDMTVYRKKDLRSHLKITDFHSPNTLEWALTLLPFPTRPGVCFLHSTMVNLPLNLINISGNRINAGAGLTVERLLELFENKLKFDVKKMTGFKNNSPHFDYVPKLIERRSPQ